MRGAEFFFEERAAVDRQGVVGTGDPMLEEGQPRESLINSLVKSASS